MLRMVLILFIQFLMKVRLCGLISWPFRRMHLTLITPTSTSTGQWILSRLLQQQTMFGYANGNLTSQELLDPELLEDPAVYPTAEVLEGLYTVPTYDAATQRVVTRMWTKITTGY